MNSDAKPDVEAVPKPKRRWFRFSLRTLLIVVTLLSFGCGWMGWKVNRIRAKQRAVQAIEEAGGSVTYDHALLSRFKQVKGVPTLSLSPYATSEAPGPAWLRRLLGDDAFADPAWVLLGPSVQLEDLLSQGHVQSLGHLPTMSLVGAGITDAGIRHLKTMKSLENLLIYDANITPAGIAELRKALPNCHIEYTPAGSQVDPPPQSP